MCFFKCSAAAGAPCAFFLRAPGPLVQHLYASPRVPAPLEKSSLTFGSRMASLWKFCVLFSMHFYVPRGLWGRTFYQFLCAPGHLGHHHLCILACSGASRAPSSAIFMCSGASGAAPSLCSICVQSSALFVLHTRFRNYFQQGRYFG